MQLFRNLHDALENDLPAIVDDAARQQSLKYLRGLNTILATTVDITPSNVIAFDDHLVRRRLARAISTSRTRQIADARRVHQRVVDEFGWDVYDDIDRPIRRA
ncbi:hypothetical protein PZB21_25695 [Rhizobium sp. CBK13]|uniref:hypothetical protein n=1 Tax=Rhizobium sp. CBK13 TaxID=3031399 RepID=UPI0023B06A68|nr:hypothetical protein [Rhizobium sp. CBK13]MDE8762570.1 hypothetical protein [Rhizobium sp. CBK13]